jgi:hypothetical protein
MKSKIQYGQWTIKNHLYHTLETSLFKPTTNAMNANDFDFNLDDFQSDMEAGLYDLGDGSKEISPASSKKLYLNGLQEIVKVLNIDGFSVDEAADWYDNAPTRPTLLEIRQQWELFNPDVEGDPFNILTFWENKRQAEWDARLPQNRTPVFPK